MCLCLIPGMAVTHRGLNGPEQGTLTGSRFLSVITVDEGNHGVAG